MVSTLAPMGAITLLVWEDPAPSGGTGPSLPELLPVRTATLGSVLGTETAGFRVAPEVTAVEAASPSAVTPRGAPQLGEDWSPVC